MIAEAEEKPSPPSGTLHQTHNHIDRLALVISEHPSLQFMQRPRKFEGKIPKLSQQQRPPPNPAPPPPPPSTARENTAAHQRDKFHRRSPAAPVTGNRITPLLSCSVARLLPVAGLGSSQQERKTLACVPCTGMLPAVNSVLNGVSSQQHYNNSVSSTEHGGQRAAVHHLSTDSYQGRDLLNTGNANNANIATETSLFQVKKESTNLNSNSTAVSSGLSGTSSSGELW